MKAGGGPHAPYFRLLAQNESKQRKGHPDSLPCGFPARFGQNRRCGIVSGLPAPHPSGAAGGDNRAPARFIAIFDRSDSPRFSRFCPAVLGYAEGDRVPRSRYGSTLSFLSGQFRPPCATSGCRATQQSAETSECRSEATHERGGVRVAQGSPGLAGTRLSEQVLLVTFGKTKVTKKNSRGPLIIVIPAKAGLKHVVL